MLSRKKFAALDASDPLAAFRARFDLPDGVIYLDGNSLGPLSPHVAARARTVIEAEWGRGLIRSWNDAGWIALPQQVGAKIARLVGAASHEVIACDSTSVNLFKLLAAALALRPGRSVLLTEAENFPTDGYVAEGLATWLGDRCEIRRVPRQELGGALDAETAALFLTHVDYKTGFRHDMAALTKAAHVEGALALWDLSHSAGAMPIDLAGCRVDLAVGCGYKYLNGGPGAPAYLFVAGALQEAFRQPLTGWMGHANPFAFGSAYEPAPGIDRALAGTPPVVQLAMLDAALDGLIEAGVDQIRAKSERMTTLFIDLVAQECPDAGFILASPTAAEDRGSQVSFRHDQGYAMMQALIAGGVIGDFRAPDIMRFGLAPLFLRYVDLWDAVGSLKSVVEQATWREPRFQERRAVT